MKLQDIDDEEWQGLVDDVPDYLADLVDEDDEYASFEQLAAVTPEEEAAFESQMTDFSETYPFDEYD